MKIAEIPVVLELALRLSIAQLRLALAGAREVGRWAAVEAGGGTASASSAGRIDALSRAVARLMLPRPTCLARSIAVLGVLHARGMPASIKVGVRMVDRRLEAHAWVEIAGAALNEEPNVSTQFNVLAAVPRDARYRP